MKKTVVLLFLFQLLLSCKGWNNNNAYAQQPELNGCLKKAIIYACPVLKYGIIPTDTNHYTTRIIKTYDSLGNLLEENSFYNLNSSTTEHITTYSGTGKYRTFTERYLSGFENKKERTYKYVWSDDYHFKIIPADPSGLMLVSELDKDFRIIKTTYKNGDTIRIIDSFAYVIKDNKLYEKTIERTINEGDTKRIILNVAVTQEFDPYGNPTISYSYDDPDKQKLKDVFLAVYEYYQEAAHPGTR